MPLETPARIVRALVGRGYNAEREAVTLIAGSDDPGRTLARVVEAAPDDALRITADHVREVLASAPAADPPGTAPTGPTAADAAAASDAVASHTAASDPSASGATSHDNAAHTSQSTPAEAKVGSGGRNVDPALRSLEIANDMTGQSTGTGEYDDFVKVFRDRYEKLSKMLRGRVNHRPAKAISNMSGGEDAELIGLVDDVRSTKSGHWIIDLEDTTGTFPCLVMKDKDIAGYVDELLMDECIAVQGTLSGDAGILFVDSMHFPDVPRSHRPNTADRDVQAALISDVHVGSQEFMAGAWNRFADWLHTEEAERIEYLLIAGDMVEGVGVYPNQDEELDVIDIYEQYEAFSEHLKSVPGDLDIVMIPGNHDAVRLAEPQPGFDDELRDIMSAHDARITSNPSMVTLEGVNVLMYHGVSLDEVIAELPADKASYDEPHKAMYQLLKKRHVAPQFGGHTRLAPEELDYLVMEDVPDIFHTGHVHKLGWGKYHNVLAVNSGCWQAQTDFQKSVNIDPDAGYAPIVDLDTLNMTVRKFS
ncbi:DNA-directed DNA polymerase II small subunit [Haloferax denitrificans]|uniref:DNA polymerase II small subunit n=1 Tax=Haloferax denitrificans ATCC 35960 TaxID=662478 RepID=M0J9A6_9EURY|nr:DNA-directed DNA polymerase II small subunit [Haloferax denitrificans]EMA05707.1 DNA polymerase II small subunit [Haloferax denitrificans ATCC 35960]